MNMYLINGKFMADRMQGVVRYARELLGALDKILEDDLVIHVLIPPNAYDIPEYKRIRIIKYGHLKGIAWEQIDLGLFIRMHSEYTLINLCNVTPLFVRPGISTVHDIMYRTFPDNYTVLRNRISRLWHIIQYKHIFSKEKIIITVSEFSKSEIAKYYSVSKERIIVIPNGWQHVLRQSENEDWQQKYPFLRKGDYYFTLATRSKNKNSEWIINTALNNPLSIFAIGGNAYDNVNYDHIENLYYLGYLSDNDACALIKNCKAFIFPSFYEGFGIPPLEALALGSPVIVSDISPFREVLGESAYYVDPSIPAQDIDSILNNSTADSEICLKKYNWDYSARLLADILSDI